MDNQKQQVIERLQQANNILVTVSNNPSVDQLSACIGLTLALNKTGKHATAVFSGKTPSTIEFLQPEQTLEKNTDSLRDFIIALDKSKADKLRYKVEDRVVKIFITPYRTSISNKDLEFSQGDFNVDVVIALGVHNQQDLDQAITAHGRILHDATVMSVNVQPGAELGGINWIDAGASSLSELGVQIVDALDKKLMDGQIATAMLTGIIAETERFSNQKTSPQTMSISAELMAAGANQQLVSTKLQEPVVVPEPPKPATMPKNDSKPQEVPAEPPKPDDGTIEIDHDKTEDIPEIPEPPKKDEPEEPQAPQIHIDEQGRLHPFGNMPDALSNTPPNMPKAPTLPSNDDPEGILPPARPDANDKLPKIKPLSDSRREGSGLLPNQEPPMLGNSPITANVSPESEDEPSTDPLSLPSVGLLNREPLPSQKGDTTADDNDEDDDDNGIPSLSTNASTPVGGTVKPTVMPPSGPTRTLSDIEHDLNSSHLLPPTSAPTPAPFSQPNIIPPTPQSPIAPLPQPMPAPQMTPTQPAPQNVAPAPAQSQSKSAPQPSDLSPAPTIDEARNAVEAAINSSSTNSTGSPEPIAALNAQPLGGEIHHTQSSSLPAPAAPTQQPQAPTPISQPQQPFSFEPTPQNPGVTPAPGAGTTPPPVPPPMMPPSFPGTPQQ